MNIGIKLINLYGAFHRRRLKFAYAFSLGAVNVYVASDARTRRQFGNAVAYALGGHIYARSRRELTKTVLRHELKHIEQGFEHGLMWPLRYWFETWRRGYHNNKFERAARRAERARFIPAKTSGAALPCHPDTTRQRLRAWLEAFFLRILG